jgi:hypothetical protein
MGAVEGERAQGEREGGLAEFGPVGRPDGDGPAGFGGGAGGFFDVNGNAAPEGEKFVSEDDEG